MYEYLISHMYYVPKCHEHEHEYEPSISVQCGSSWWGRVRVRDVQDKAKYLGTPHPGCWHSPSTSLTPRFAFHYFIPSGRFLP